MKHILLFFLSLLILGSCGQEKATKIPLKKNLIALVQEGNSFYYINTAGEKLFDQSFSVGTHFSEGLACVRQNGIWHFIDTAGNKVIENIPLKYPSYFSNGKAMVNRSNQALGIDDLRYMDKQGNLSETNYGYATPYEFGVAGASCMKDGVIYAGFIDSEENYVLRYNSDSLQLAMEAGFTRPGAHTYTEGLVPIYDKHKIEQNRVGFYGHSGDYEIEPQFFKTGIFLEGLCPVSILDENRELKWGYINTSGDVVIDLQYEDALHFRDGVAAVKKGTREWLVIDKTGKIVFEHYYGLVFSEGRAVTGKLGHDKLGYKDKSGTTVIDLKFDYAGTFHNGLAEVEVNGKVGFINLDGEYVIRPKYDAVGMFVDPFETNHLTTR